MNRISSVVVLTDQVLGINREILCTLRHVLSVEQIQEGYLIVLEEPVRDEDCDPLLRAIRNFVFVKDAKAIRCGLEHNLGVEEVKRVVLDFLKDQIPRVTDYEGDYRKYATDVYAWTNVRHAIDNALWPPR